MVVGLGEGARGGFEDLLEPATLASVLEAEAGADRAAATLASFFKALADHAWVKITAMVLNAEGALELTVTT